MSGNGGHEPRHYVELCAEHLSRGQRMPSETYGAAMANLILVCTDAVIIDRERKTMWLAMRIRKPAKDTWWWIGGTLLRGRGASEGIAETFFRETGLRIEPERFQFVRMVRYWWKDRAQEPEDVGSDNLVYTYCVELSDDERKLVAISLDPEEYDQEKGLQEFDRERLVRENVHPVILDTYDAIFPESESGTSVAATNSAFAIVAGMSEVEIQLSGMKIP